MSIIGRRADDSARACAFCARPIADGERRGTITHRQPAHELCHWREINATRGGVSGGQEGQPSGLPVPRSGRATGAASRPRVGRLEKDRALRASAGHRRPAPARLWLSLLAACGAFALSALPASANLALDITVPSCEVDSGYRLVAPYGVGRMTIFNQDLMVIHQEANVPFEAANCVARMTVDFRQADAETAPACSGDGIPSACCTGTGLGKCLLQEFLDPNAAFFVTFEVCKDANLPCDFTPSGDANLRASPTLATLAPMNTLLNDVQAVLQGDLAAETAARIAADDAETAAREAGDADLESKKVNRNGGDTINGGLTVNDGLTLDSGDLTLSTGKLTTMNDVGASQYLVDKCPAGLDAQTATFTNPSTGANTKLCASDFMSATEGNITLEQQLAEVSVAACNAIAKFPATAAVDTVTTLFAKMLTASLNFLVSWINSPLEATLDGFQVSINAVVNGVASGATGAVNGLAALTVGAVNTLGGGAQTAINTIGSRTQDAVNGLASAIRTAINGIVTAINSIVSGINDIVGTLNDVIGDVNSICIGGCGIKKVSKVGSVDPVSFGGISIRNVVVPTVAPFDPVEITPINLDENFAGLIPMVSFDQIKSALDVVLTDPAGQIWSAINVSKNCTASNLDALEGLLVTAMNIGLSQVDVNGNPVKRVLTKDSLVPVFQAAAKRCAQMNAHVCTTNEVYLLTDAAGKTSPRAIGYEGGEWVDQSDVVVDAKAEHGFNFKKRWIPVNLATLKLFNWPPGLPFELDGIPVPPTGRFQCCLGLGA